MIRALTLSERGDFLVPRVTCLRGNRRVYLQGMMHAAAPHFFHHIQDFLEERERTGSCILHEVINPEVAFHPRTPVEQEEREGMIRFNEGMRVVLMQHRLACQQYTLQERDSWNSVDFSWEEWKKICPATRRVPPMSPEEWGQFLIKNIGRLANPSAQEGLKRSNWFPLIVAARNKRAIRMTLRAVERTDVTMHYGSMHIDGIVKGLCSDGFEIEKIDHVLAIPKELIPQTH